MQRINTLYAGVWLSLLIPNGPALAQADGSVQTGGRYFIDVAHSNVSFSVRHLGLTRVRGIFNEWSGTIMYDSADVDNSSVTIVIDTRSFDTGHERRDNDVRSNWLDVEEFPDIVFQSTAVQASGADWALRGALRIHGVTREVTIPFTFLGRHGPLGGLERIAFSGRITFPRSDFGVVNEGHMFEAVGFMGPDVAIDLDIIAGRIVEAPALRGSESGGKLLYDVLQAEGMDAAVMRHRAETGDSTSTFRFQAFEFARLGFVLFDEGRSEEAVRLHELNVAANPDDYEAHYWLADAYAMAGAADAALASYERVLALDPPKTGTVFSNFTDTIEMLRTLRGHAGVATLLEEGRR